MEAIAWKRVVGTLAFFAFWMLPKGASGPEVVPAADPILGLTLVQLVEGADEPTAREAVAGLEQLMARKGQATRTLAFRNAKAERQLVIAVEWPSLKAAEDGGLTYDGSEVKGRLRALASGRQAVWFRKLRGSGREEAEGGHLEVVLFRTPAGMTREAHLKLFDEADALFVKAEDCLAHSLWIAPDGTWLHLVRWTSAEAFARGSRALMREGGVRRWISSLDFRRFDQRHGDAF